jgi:hypothetical protein
MTQLRNKDLAFFATSARNKCDVGASGDVMSHRCAIVYSLIIWMRVNEQHSVSMKRGILFDHRREA